MLLVSILAKRTTLSWLKLTGLAKHRPAPVKASRIIEMQLKIKPMRNTCNKVRFFILETYAAQVSKNNNKQFVSAIRPTSKF